MEQNRRDFIKGLSLACGSVLFLEACQTYESPWRFFTISEAELIIAIAEQIIPGDEDPGATDANVINFIDKQLAGYYSEFQDIYRNGISAVQKSSERLHHKEFQQLQWDIQTNFLQKMSNGELPQEDWPENKQKEFFEMIRNHTMQGFYGSPRHGGNKYYMSYKMLKFDYPHVIGQNRYR